VFTPARLVIALALLVVPSFALAHGPGPSNDFGGRRVLLFGIDGCRPDALKKLVDSGRAPNLKALIDGGTVTWNAFAGAEPNAQVPQDTVSGPGWTTILTGVWREKHGVADNRFRTHRIAAHPHLFRRLKTARPTAWVGSLVDWPEIHYHIAGESRTDGRAFLDYELTELPAPARRGTDYAELDVKIANQAVAQLRKANPDALFVYFGNVDETGHGVAHRDGRFSPDNEPYLSALAEVDALIGQVLAAVRARPQYAAEKWLILATTDHGGRGTNHGGQTPEERTIWMLANGPGVKASVVEPGPVPQTAIAPTVFQFLRLPLPPDWEAKPFGLSVSK
jgi:predicted AlkP superfamily pyrophosphatase or phosphodiesterase